MSVYAGPNFIEDGLVLYYDGANIKSRIPDNNILNASTWISGTNGGQTGFDTNGSSTENYIITDVDPFGNSANLWEARPDGVSGPDGGWNSSLFPIDHTKLYRFSVWINRTVTATSGRFYLGTRGYNSSGNNVGILNRSNGSNNTNPYFEITNSPPNSNQLPQGQWILVVGHVFPSVSGTGDVHPNSGMYDVNGNRMSGESPNDYIWNTTNTQSLHRSYLFYTLDTVPRQRWCYPRVDVVDGTEPSISDLINNRVNSLYTYDVASFNDGTNLNGVSYNQSNLGSFVFDGTDDFITVPQTVLSSSGSTVSGWINIADFSTGKSSTGRTFIRGTSNFTSMIAFYNGGYSFESDTNSNPHEISGRTTGNVTSSAIVAGTWFHFTLVFNNGSFIGYVNGVETGSATIPNSLTFDRIGDGSGFATSYPAFFKGKISSFAVYDRALSEAEVKRNFNSTRGRFGL